MRAKDVTDTLDLALQASGCDQVHVVHKPRLLSELPIDGANGSSPMGDGSSYVSSDLAEWLQDKGMKHSRGAPYHPQTQGKIERWHQTLKKRILLENYFLPPLTHALHVLPGNGRPRNSDRNLRRPLQSPALPREPEQYHTV